MANQAWQITAPGTLTLNSVGEIPRPGPKQVLLRVHAISLNFRDILVVDHSPAYPTTAIPNLIPGSDGAGVIESVGADSRWKAGDRVIVHPNSWYTGFDNKKFDINTVYGGGDVQGTMRGWMILGDEQMVKAPKGLSMEEASTMFTAGATAFRALFHGGVEVGPGTTVLTQGTGGVSCYAILLAAAAGATVIATSSSDEKLETARKLGAAHLINYRTTPDWENEVLKVTGGKGVELVVDVVGAESIEQSLKATGYGGTIVVVGLLSKDPFKPVNIMTDVLYGVKTVTGHLGAGSREVSEEMSAFMEKHDLHPQVAEVYEFEKAQEALKALTNLTAPGKIVVRC